MRKYDNEFKEQAVRKILDGQTLASVSRELVVRALQMGLRRGLIGKNAIVHTYRGSQYVSNLYRELLQQYGLRQSMSGKGNCYDNAQAESLFGRFKAELVEGGLFESVEQARSETFSYIDGYYNRIRRHSGIGYLSPLEFEKLLETHVEMSQLWTKQETLFPQKLGKAEPPFPHSHNHDDDHNIQKEK